MIFTLLGIGFSSILMHNLENRNGGTDGGNLVLFLIILGICSLIGLICDGILFSYIFLYLYEYVFDLHAYKYLYDNLISIILWMIMLFKIFIY
jgi:hypothetical protein